MDPSYNNSFGNVPQGGITSGGSAGVPAGGIMSGGSGAGGSAGGGITSGGGYSVPVSSGTGDIVLGGGQKKSKRGLIIGIILGLVLVVGVVVGVLVLPGVLKTNDNKVAFNKYANFVLYGNEDEGYRGTDYEISYFESQMSDIEKARAFFDKADVLWSKTDVEISGDLGAEYSQQREMYEFLSVIYKRDILRRNVVTEYYIENGEEATKKYIDEYYDVSEETSNLYLRDLKETFSLWGNSIMDKIAIYDNVGCLTQFEDYGCFNDKASDEQKEKAEDLNAEYAQNNQIYVNYFSTYQTYVLVLQQVSDTLNSQERQ